MGSFSSRPTVLNSGVSEQWGLKSSYRDYELHKKVEFGTENLVIIFSLFIMPATYNNTVAA